MLHGIPRPQGWDKYIPYIGEIKAEEDEKEGMIEFLLFSPELQGDSQGDREKIISSIGELKQIRQKGMHHLFKGNGGISAEEPVIQPDEQIIQVLRVDGMNDQPEAVENNDDADDREQDIPGKPEKRVDPVAINDKNLKDDKGCIENDQIPGKGDPAGESYRYH
jgi:hypothetical protein